MVCPSCDGSLSVTGARAGNQGSAPSEARHHLPKSPVRQHTPPPSAMAEEPVANEQDPCSTPEQVTTHQQEGAPQSVNTIPDSGHHMNPTTQLAAAALASMKHVIDDTNTAEEHHPLPGSSTVVQEMRTGRRPRGVHKIPQPPTVATAKSPGKRGRHTSKLKCVKLDRKQGRHTSKHTQGTKDTRGTEAPPPRPRRGLTTESPQPRRGKRHRIPRVYD